MAKRLPTSEKNMLSTLQRDPKNLDLKTDLMVEFTVGGMLAVLQRWPELSDTIESKTCLKKMWPCWPWAYTWP